MSEVIPHININLEVLMIHCTTAEIQMVQENLGAIPWILKNAGNIVTFQCVVSITYISK
jgi:hypothetical protein